jgi:hypothetical protein
MSKREKVFFILQILNLMGLVFFGYYALKYFRYSKYIEAYKQMKPVLFNIKEKTQ